jgi:hypothetical protein
VAVALHAAADHNRPLADRRRSRASLPGSFATKKVILQ